MSKPCDRIHFHRSPMGEPVCGEASSGVLVCVELWDKVTCLNCLSDRND